MTSTLVLAVLLPRVNPLPLVPMAVAVSVSSGVPEICTPAVLALMKNVVALGGAISGEHGIGLAKTPFLRLQHSAAAIGAMRAVKQALDPKGILNPGKMFDVFEVWKAPRVVASFPWDHK